MPDPTSHQQYAVLPWRRAEALEILLITSRETGRWVIPKGWPIPGHSEAESAAQEAYEEAGVRGRLAAAPLGHYDYRKRLRGGGKKPFRVEVFALEVTEILDLWPEAHQRRRQWVSPEAAAELVHEPQLAALMLAFAGDRTGQALPGLTWTQALRRALKVGLRLLGLR